MARARRLPAGREGHLPELGDKSRVPLGLAAQSGRGGFLKAGSYAERQLEPRRLQAEAVSDTLAENAGCHGDALELQAGTQGLKDTTAAQDSDQRATAAAMHAHMKPDLVEASPLAELTCGETLAGERSEGGPQGAPVRVLAADNDAVRQTPAHDLKAETNQRFGSGRRLWNRRRQMHSKRGEAFQEIPYDRPDRSHRTNQAY